MKTQMMVKGLPMVFLVAMVASMTDASKKYAIMRAGKAKSDGGDGVKWACSCPAYRFGNGRFCKHLAALWGNKLADSQVEMTDEGRVVLNRPVAA